MAKFRKKPVVIEAVQWNGPNTALPWPIPGFETRSRGRGNEMAHYGVIPTLEGRMEVSPGDWIIQGVKGEFYPCKPEIFTATYDAVDP